VWFRLRRVLADASEIHAIPPHEARKLIAEGYPPEPVGQELELPKLIVFVPVEFVPVERITQIAEARPLPARLGTELLDADCLAPTRFA
jgi:hypothetical protein